MSNDRLPPVTVNSVLRLTSERHTRQGMAHDVHVVLTGKLTVQHAEQRLRLEGWPHQASWPLTFEPTDTTSATRIVLGGVVDQRQDEAVEELRACLDRLQRL